MKKMHKTQREILNIIKEYGSEPWTIRDLQERLNISSPSLIFHHLQMLTRKGYIRRDPECHTSYQLLSEVNDSIIYLDTYGMAKCGPDGHILSGEPIDKIPISRKLLTFNVEDAFMMTAEGDSMEPRIYEGDYVIIMKSNTAENGQMVLCTYNGKTLIKVFKKVNDMITLNSLNIEYFPINVKPSDELYIEGIVKGIVSYSVK